MAKNIVLLSDGTGNSAGKLFKTNVWRLYQALDLSAGPTGEPRQIAYYHDGVGSSAFKPLAVLGGAFGWGLKRNVIDIYTFLCRNYEPADRIYAFGFSRGAFTMRVLTGLINSQGLVRAETESELMRLARKAFREYRRSYRTALGLEKVARGARDLARGVMSLVVKEDAPDTLHPNIHFLGLWDTVDAYGLPFDELTRAWDAVFPLSFPDREPCKNVDRACHALALDDERNTFHPVLWNEAGMPARKHIRDERITQVWFPGMHASVGGGYPDDALANVSLHWMMQQAQQSELLLLKEELDRIESARDPYGKLYDSRAGLGGAYRYLPRKLAALTHDIDDEKDQVVIERPKIHESVLNRIAHGTDGYAPIVLPASYAVVREDGSIVDLPAGDAAGLPENARQAKDRARLQEKVWNLVWARRIVYFLSVFAGIWLALFPLFHAPAQACSSSLCGLTWVLRAAGALLPSFAALWLATYETHPAEFFAGLAVCALLLLAGGRLRAMISDEMRRIWKRDPGRIAPEASDWLYRLRSSEPYQRTWKETKWVVLPALAGAVAVFFIGAGINNGMFALVNSTGALCPPTAPGMLVERLVDGRFATATPCWASGVQLKEGIRYRVTLRIDEPWKDGGLSATVAGIEGKTPFLMNLWTPVRRYVSEPWFKPIARVGSKGSDEYPLDPSDVLNRDETGATLVAEITARSSGELFLFVNDAVLPVPGWQPFYANNAGNALVTVRPARSYRDPKTQRGSKSDL